MEAKLRRPAQNVAAFMIDKEVFPLCGTESPPFTLSTVPEGTSDMDGIASVSTEDSSTEDPYTTDILLTEETLSTIDTDTTSYPSSTEDWDVSESSTMMHTSDLASTTIPLTTDVQSTTELPKTGSITFSHLEPLSPTLLRVLNIGRYYFHFRKVHYGDWRLDN